jgi:hypothetical protein
LAEWPEFLEIQQKRKQPNIFGNSTPTSAARLRNARAGEDVLRVTAP